MRYLFCGLLVLAPTAAWADDNAAVKELLDKVVKAHGGADKATEFGSLTFKGTVKAPGGKANFKAEASMDGLDRIRLNLTATVTNESATFVWDGDKMWAHATARNQTEELRGEAAQMMLSSVLAMRLAGLPTSMASSKELHLAHGGEAKVGETDAVILRVSRKDRPDILLYYDKKT
ncbi:MAG: hypothetical protein ACJ8F7_19320 [Gemmataceae bacterium]